MVGTLTAANAIIQLTAPGVFDLPQQLQQFSADNIFSTEDVKAGEVSMGVDGTLSAGFTYAETIQFITLQANSPSCDFFDQLWQAEQALGDKYQIFGTYVLPAISRKWVAVNGYLTTYKPMPDAAKLLMPRRFGLTWQSLVAAQIV